MGHQIRTTARSPTLSPRTHPSPPHCPALHLNWYHPYHHQHQESHSSSSSASSSRQLYKCWWFCCGHRPHSLPWYHPQSSFLQHHHRCRQRRLRFQRWIACGSILHHLDDRQISPALPREVRRGRAFLLPRQTCQHSPSIALYRWLHRRHARRARKHPLSGRHCDTRCAPRQTFACTAHSPSPALARRVPLP